MEPVVSVGDLSKSYGDFSLCNVDLVVEPGCVCGLVGPNGAGKSTLIKCLLGLVRPDGGSVEVLGEAVPWPPSDAASLKARVGVVLDTCAFPRDVRAGDVAALGRHAYPAWDQGTFDRLVGDVPRRKRVRDLSRGMGMRLSLAFALAHRPDLLVLDEATAGLDPMARDGVLDEVRAFMGEDGRAVLMATHITSDLDKVADRVVCLKDGRVAFDLSKEQICDEAGLAHLTAAQFERVLAAGIDGLRWERRAFETVVLAPDRRALAAACPKAAVERPSVEEYMTLALDGEDGKGARS